MKILIKLPDPEDDYVLVEIKDKKARLRLQELIFGRDPKRAMGEIFSKCEPLAYVPHVRISEYKADLILTPDKALCDTGSRYFPKREKGK